ncbi:MAG: hypothetical protein JNK90_23205 [Planctomycetaceae bacterium]|nr:hypothetical protein [Planctomycetaceae bacterium]
MSQLQHTLKMLSYRMRRYPLWIAVLLLTIPLFLSARWLASNFPWTSSNALEVDFIRVSERFWVKHVEFIPQRGPIYFRAPPCYNAATFLIDLEHKTLERLQCKIPIDPARKPLPLANGTLLLHALEPYQVVIYDPQTSEVRVKYLPTYRGLLVNGRFLICENYRELTLIDLFADTPLSEAVVQKFYCDIQLRAVEQSSHILVSSAIDNAAWDCIDTLRAHSLVLDGILYVLDQLSVSSGFTIERPWKLHSLYWVAPDGLERITSWLGRSDLQADLSSGNGLVCSTHYSGNYLHIREASSGKVVATHPLHIRDTNGTTPAFATSLAGAMFYRFPNGRVIAIDPLEPQKVFMSGRCETWPAIFYDRSLSVYCTIAFDGPFSHRTAPGTIQFRDEETTEVIASWQGEKWLGLVEFLSFENQGSTLIATDDRQRLLKFDTNTGKVIDRFEPYKSWPIPLSLILLGATVWYLALSISTQQLRLHGSIRAIISLAMLGSLATIRLQSIGDHDFTERFSFQTLIAILTLLAFVGAECLWRTSIPRLHACLLISSSVVAIGVVIHKLQHAWPVELEIFGWVALMVSVLLLLFGIAQIAQKLFSSGGQRNKWQLSNQALVFWITAISLIAATVRYCFAGNSIYEPTPWVELAQLLCYPMLGIGIWRILQLRQFHTLYKLSTLFVWFLLVTVFRISFSLGDVDSISYMWYLKEETIYSFCATTPTAMLFLAHYLPLPRGLIKLKFVSWLHELRKHNQLSKGE